MQVPELALVSAEVAPAVSGAFVEELQVSPAPGGTDPWVLEELLHAATAPSPTATAPKAESRIKRKETLMAGPSYASTVELLPWPNRRVTLSAVWSWPIWRKMTQA